MIKTNIDVLRNKIIELAMLQFHKVYIHGMHGPDTFDCAGFVWYIYHEILGIDIYKGGYGASTTGMILTSTYGVNRSLDDAKKGDILFFHRQSKDAFETTINNKYPGHCGIYLGDGRFIHCSGTKKRVVINSFYKSEYWNKVLVDVKDIVSDIRVRTLYKK